MQLTTIKPVIICLTTLCAWSMIPAISYAVQAPSQSQVDSDSAAPDPATRMREALALADGMSDVTDAEVRAEMLGKLRDHFLALQVSAANDPWLFFLNAQLLTLTGQRGDAIAQLRLFVQTREGMTSWRAHRDLGDLFVAEFPQLAKASYEKAAQLTTNEPSVLYGLSKCAAKLGHRADAIDYAQRAAEAKPSVKHWTNLAKLFVSDKQWDQAGAAANAALQLARENAANHSHVQSYLITVEAQQKIFIDILHAKHQDDQTTDHDDALQLVSLYRQRAELIRTIILHDTLQSIEELLLTATAEAWTDLMYESATILEDMGRTDEAIQKLQEVLAKDPSQAKAFAMRDRLKKS